MSKLRDLSRLCIHTITTKQWSLEQCIQKYSAAGVAGITVWRDVALKHPRGIKAAGDLCRSEGLEIVSYVRGGFFTGGKEKRQIAIDENKKVIDEAVELGAPLVVLVCGATPGQSLATSRQQIADGISDCLPHALAAGVKLGIEPLHPMYADSRSAVNTLTQANDMAIEINHPHLGVTVDVYHLWWDDRLQGEIKRCAEADKLYSFHICDWMDQPSDLLNDRGLMGEGVIPVCEIREWVEATGFTGFNEVEIFSHRWWSQDSDEFLQSIVSAYLRHS